MRQVEEEEVGATRILEIKCVRAEKKNQVFCLIELESIWVNARLKKKLSIV